MNFDDLIKEIQDKKPYFIAIAGIPGSGKSTLSQKIQSHLPNSIALPMDGYHYYLKDLTPEGKR